MTKTLTAPPLRCKECGWPWHVLGTTPLEVPARCPNDGAKMEPGLPLTYTPPTTPPLPTVEED